MIVSNFANSYVTIALSQKLAADVRAIAGAMNLTDEQKEAMSTLAVGSAKPAPGRLNPPLIRTNSTLDHVEIGCTLPASQNDGGFRAVWKQFAGRFAGVAGVAAMNHAAGNRHAGFRGVQGCNPSSPLPPNPAPGTPAPHTVKSNFLSATGGFGARRKSRPVC